MPAATNNISFVSLATNALDTVRDKTAPLSPRPTVHEAAYLLFQSIKHVQRAAERAR